MVVALVAIVFVAIAGVAADAPEAEAASASQFDPGMLISDAAFFNGGAMTAEEVQTFLESQVSACTGTAVACLREYRQTTSDKAAVSGRCAAYTGGSNQLASKIIADVGKACGISQKALLVLIQKEQSLITRSDPTASQYRSATGYGCPDTAACDSAYYGFFNQVYMAALQFKRYAASPDSWKHVAGKEVEIYLHPDLARCGTQKVYIRNQATAGLYNYTPYTPNAAALANLYGTGDSCSSYGNRNFWRIYTDWFGPTSGDMSPFGALATAKAAPGAIVVTGWAVDPDSFPSAVRIHFYIDGKHVSNGVADGTNSSLVSAYSYYGETHAFSATVPAKAGKQQICAYGINIGAGKNALLGCKTVMVGSGDPIGRLDSVVTAPGQITYSGWALDPDTSQAIRVHSYLDGVLVDRISTNKVRADVSAVYPLYGEKLGYASTVTGISAGTHRLCTYGINAVAPGKNALLGCTEFTMPSGSPYGRVDSVQFASAGTYTVLGWAIDPDTANPIRVHVYVDGVHVASGGANKSRADVAKAYPGYGEQHGYAINVSGVSAGVHRVCVYGINVGVGSNSLLQCKNLDFPGGAPRGAFDSSWNVSADTLQVTGWALDPDTGKSITVRVDVDGIPRVTTLTGLDRSDVEKVLRGYGRAHGFSATLKLSGTHRVCVTAFDSDGSSSTRIGCRTLTIPSSRTAPESDPEGSLVVAPGAGGALTLSGWAADPDADVAIRVHGYVNGALLGDSWKVTANRSTTAAAARFPSYAQTHGYLIEQTGLASGETELCLYGINATSTAGANALIACARVVLP